MEQMNVGDRIKFNYYGGSKYGQTRIVKVTKITPTFIEGIDENENAYKKYRRGSMGATKTLATLDLDSEAVELQAFLRKHPDYSTKLVEEFNKKYGANYIWTNDKKLVNKSFVKTVIGKLDGDGKSICLTIPATGVTRKNLVLRAYKNGDVYIDGSYECYNAGLYEILKAL